MSDDELLVTLQDCSRAALCRRGTRKFCQQHGLDYDRLRKEGLPASQLLALNDLFAAKAVARAKERKRG